MNPSLYIPGIDGLRALSVIAVICYHLDSSLLPGGYTGVDVFFVISGYVISKSLAGSSFSSFTDYITGFYKRRIVRIFPALVVCLLATSVGTVLFIPESWLSELNGKTGVAAFFGLSNLILLLFDDGYFAPKGEFNPFLHTWSLAVEEQFYFFFPPIFYAWLRFRGHRNLTGALSRHALGALFLLSLLFAYFTTKNNPVLAFYLLPSRLWELAAGVILFQIQQRWQKKVWPQWLLIALSLGGSGCLVCSFVLPALLPFPCPWGGISVIGAFVLLAAIVQSGEQKTVIIRFLASAPMSYVGKLSYSLYLWHWPIFSLSRWTNGFDDTIEKLLAVLLAFILAALSFHFVEQPIRIAGALKKQRSIGVLSKGLTVIVFSSLFAATLFLMQPKLSMSVTRDRYTWYPYASDADDTVKTGKPLEGKKMFVMGDSHAGAYTTMLEKISEKTGIELIPLTKGGCSVLNLLKPLSDGAACSAALSESLNVIRSEAKEGDVVFLASLRMVRYGNQWEPYPEKVVNEKQKAMRDPVRRAEIESEAESFIDDLGKIGLRVLIDAPKPIFKAPAFRCSDWFNESNPVCGPGFTMSRAQLENERQPVMETLDKLAKENSNLSVWDPFPVLCPEKECGVMDQEKPLFFDGDHLSGHGNLVLLPSFEKHLLSLFGKVRQ